jgi:hypothetical protein
MADFQFTPLTKEEREHLKKYSRSVDLDFDDGDGKVNSSYIDAYVAKVLNHAKSAMEPVTLKGKNRLTTNKNLLKNPLYLQFMAGNFYVEAPTAQGSTQKSCGSCRSSWWTKALLLMEW